jgi:hypothetical protein
MSTHRLELGPSGAREPSAARKRRNASEPSTTNQQSQSKSFEFVLVTDTESRRQVRRHAMRQYMHQRRLDSIARLGAPRVPATGWTSRPASDGSSLQAPGDQANNASNDMPVQQKQKSPPTDEELPPKNKEKASSNRASAKPQQVKREATSLALVRKPQYLNPTATPEKGAMRDPFGTYPMAISDVDYQLIQHCELTTDLFF